MLARLFDDDDANFFDTFTFHQKKKQKQPANVNGQRQNPYGQPNPNQKQTPYGPENRPQNQNQTPYGPENKPSDPYANQVPYGPENRPYDPYGNQIPYGPENRPYDPYGNQTPYGPDNRPYGPDNRPYGPDNRPYGYNDPSQNISGTEGAIPYNPSRSTAAASTAMTAKSHSGANTNQKYNSHMETNTDTRNRSTFATNTDTRLARSTAGINTDPGNGRSEAGTGTDFNRRPLVARRSEPQMRTGGRDMAIGPDTRSVPTNQRNPRQSGQNAPPQRSRDPKKEHESFYAWVVNGKLDDMHRCQGILFED